MIFQIMKSGTYETADETVYFNHNWVLLRIKRPAILGHSFSVAGVISDGSRSDCWADNEFARKAMRVVKND